MHFDEQNMRRPDFFQENRLPAHSDHEAFASMDELIRGENSLRMSLNGYWRFFHAINPAQILPGFEQPEFDCRRWAQIAVPAHIQMEGYGAPQYANVQYPWDGIEPLEIGEMPREFNPVGCYVKYFTLPEAMRGKRVRVCFEGAESAIAVYLNGHYIGYAADTFTPSEFDLTDCLVEGENKLACRVYRWNAGSWFEDQDFMRFSGLYRGVYLYALPEAHLEDMDAKATLDERCTQGTLKLDLKVTADAGWTANVRLSRGGETAFEGECRGELTISIDEPALWSAEYPNLYDLDIELKDASGNVCEVVREKVGFRRFELKDGLMTINGKRIVFKGVNRHDFCAETGRAVPKDKLKRDLLTMKRNNINAIRTSHYPNPSVLYKLADELGLYVIDECNLETHGVVDLCLRGEWPKDICIPGDRTEWLPMLLDRVESMIKRDRNHASILIWSCGNESYGGSVIYEMSRCMREHDDTRLVHYEGFFDDRRPNKTSDMESRMYTPVTGILEILKEVPDKPFILCEYTHAMGNSCGAMHKYTDLTHTEPRYQGGFIWDFIDQSVRARDRYGDITYLYGGDFDDRPNDGNFSGNGIVYGDGTESPKMQEVRYNYRDIHADITRDAIRITNHALFTPTGEYDCVAILERDGVKVAEMPIEQNVAPLAEAVLPNPFRDVTIPGEYAVTLSFRQKADTPWAPRGHEVAFGQGVFTAEGEKAPERSHAPLRVVYGMHNLGVIGECFEVQFGYLAGGLTSYRYGGVEMLKTVPRPNFWRAPNDNDRGNAMMQRYAQWKIASMYLSTQDPNAADPFNLKENPHPVTEHPDGTVSIRFRYFMPTTPAAQCEVTYTVHPSGKVDVLLGYDPVEGLHDMPEFGMMLKLKSDYDRVKYYGMGPGENNIDRSEGARLGTFEYDVKANVSRYLVPQECGNRTGVRRADVIDYRGRGLRFLGDNMEFSALPYTPHELENAAHDFELPPVHYTVIRVAKQQMGIAGDDSWGARTHAEYLIDTSSRLEFKFSFEGII